MIDVFVTLLIRAFATNYVRSVRQFSLYGLTKEDEFFRVYHAAKQIAFLR